MRVLTLPILMALAHLVCCTGWRDRGPMADDSQATMKAVAGGAVRAAAERPAQCAHASRCRSRRPAGPATTRSTPGRTWCARSSSCAIFVVVLLLVWSLLVDAPLEEPANPTRTPNPSKAPWYFLGLQEMLVFFDPWHAGVVLPTFIIIGLMVIPYIDINPHGNGYYTFDRAQVRAADLLPRLPRPLGVADHHRHVPARPGLELVLAVGDVGPAQGRGDDQRRPAVPGGDKFRAWVPPRCVLVGDVRWC